MTRLAERVSTIIIEFLRTVAGVEGTKSSNCPLRRIITSQTIMTVTTASLASIAASLA